MKKIVMLSFITAMLFLSVSGFCRAADKPEAVYKKYIKAIKDGKFDEAIKYMPKVLVDFYAKQPEAAKKTFLAVQRGTIPEEFTVKDIKIDGKQAIMKYEGTGKEGKAGTSYTYKASVTFVEENGNWKVMQQSREVVNKK
jgi:hypothetical protein